MSADYLIILASGVVIIYALILELYKSVKNREWFPLILFSIVLLVVGWIIYEIWFKEKSKTSPVPTDKEEELSDNEQELQKAVEVPKSFEMLEDRFEIGPGEKVILEPTMNYEKFKQIYKTPEFIQQYIQSLKLAQALKIKRYRKVKSQLNNELNTLAPKKKDFTSLITGDVADAIRKAIRELDLLIEEVSKIKVTSETILKNLDSALYDNENGLETLTGRSEVKDFLAVRIYTFVYNPRIFFTKFQNILLYGGSGYGKTKIGQVIGHVLTKSGLLIRGKFVQTTKSLFVSPYVNLTAGQTRSVLLSTLESVLFIDEAYDITPPKDMIFSTDHGHEAITEIVNFIGMMYGLSVIIAAGYTDEMETRFLASNQGLERRFLPPIILKPYNAEELTKILVRFLLETNPDLEFKNNHYNYLYSIIKWIEDSNPDTFEKQAGDMQNLSSDISNLIYSNLSSWPSNYKRVLLDGFNNFLYSKGISISECELS